MPLQALLIAAALAAPATPTELRATSRISAVTVYRSTARVTRLTDVVLPAGDVRLVVEGLSAELEDDSVRIHGEGVARVKLYGSTVSEVRHDQSVSPKVQAAEMALQSLVDEQGVLDDDEVRAKARLDLATSIRAAYAEERSHELPFRAPDSKELNGLADLIVRQMALAQAETRKDEGEKRELTGRLEAARAALGQLRSLAGRVTKSLAIDLSVARPGPFQLRIDHSVGAASWSPIWDARLDPTRQNVELRLYGSVSQRTGEDWSSVRLELSTAQPRAGLAIPVLEPDYLGRRRRFAPRPQAISMTASMPAAAPLAISEISEAPLEAPGAQLQEGFLSQSYLAPRPESVSGSGLPHRAFVASVAVTGQLTRTAVPALDPAVYLGFEGANGSGATLLSGPASLYVGDELVGRAELPETAPGEKLKLAFGVDDRVRVERKVIERERATEGLFSKTVRMRYRIRTTVENLYPTAVDVVLIERLPVSQDKEISVTTLEGSAVGEPVDPMKPGVLRFPLALGAGEKRSVELRYDVRWPADVPVNGLE
ncbi:MAG: mucoidy inhibitor MuiA family protein [Deltaproteobacteria bacterium]